MARILSISVREEDEWVIDELKALGGSLSFRFVEGAKVLLEGKGQSQGKPFWFVDGKDYSYLPLEERQFLAKFGYTDKEVGLATEAIQPPKDSP